MTEHKNETRIILKDARFGELSYHKKFVNNTTFPSHLFLCNMPFEYAEVRRHGGVNICCPQWNPAEIGSIFENDLATIWNGEKANIIRDSIINGNYSYCNFDTCPRIRNWKTTGQLTSKTAEETKRILGLVSSTPASVHFVIDTSCNLVCPSCRIDKTSQLTKTEQDRGKLAIKNTLECMFSEPHTEHKIIGMDGSGEVFSSEVYRELFETEDVFTKTYLWPNLKFVLNTNGTMMTEKIQKKYAYFFMHVGMIDISVDAGNKESYEKVRVGGNWELLWKNLEYLYTTIKNKPTRWKWNVIVQQNNYKSIPDLINIANKFTENKPVINLGNVLNWGTWTEEEYLKHAVHLPSHPEYSLYLAIINSARVATYLSTVK